MGNELISGTAPCNAHRLYRDSWFEVQGATRPSTTRRWTCSAPKQCPSTKAQADANRDLTGNCHLETPLLASTPTNGMTCINVAHSCSPTALFCIALHSCTPPLGTAPRTIYSRHLYLPLLATGHFRQLSTRQQSDHREARQRPEQRGKTGEFDAHRPKSRF